MSNWWEQHPIDIREFDERDRYARYEPSPVLRERARSSQPLGIGEIPELVGELLGVANHNALPEFFWVRLVGAIEYSRISFLPVELEGRVASAVEALPDGALFDAVELLELKRRKSPERHPTAGQMPGILRQILRDHLVRIIGERFKYRPPTESAPISGVVRSSGRPNQAA